VGVLAGAALFRPRVARAQPAGKVPRIGYLSVERAVPSLFHSHDAVFDGLHERGYADGRNIVIEYRYAAGKVEQLPSLAAELAALPVDLILAISTPAAQAALAATRTIPIVFARVGDPVGNGLVASLARPGGNATGVTVFSAQLADKRIEALKDAIPGLSRLAVLHDPIFSPRQVELKQIMAAASSQKVQIHAVDVRSPAALEQALPGIMKESPQALLVESGGWFEAEPQQIVEFALRNRLPALYGRREYAESGGFMSCGIDYREMYRTATDYIVRILKGALPAVTPVQGPTTIGLVINMKTAKALGLTIPPALLLRANQIFQ
jgi:putative ABC transport system substrate-binding protein